MATPQTTTPAAAAVAASMPAAHTNTHTPPPPSATNTSPATNATNPRPQSPNPKPQSPKNQPHSPPHVAAPIPVNPTGTLTLPDLMSDKDKDGKERERTKTWDSLSPTLKLNEKFRNEILGENIRTMKEGFLMRQQGNAQGKKWSVSVFAVCVCVFCMFCVRLCLISVLRKNRTERLLRTCNMASIRLF